MVGHVIEGKDQYLFEKIINYCQYELCTEEAYFTKSDEFKLQMLKDPVSIYYQHTI